MEMEFILLDLLGIVVISIKKCNKKTPQSYDYNVLVGAPSGIRTLGTLIKSQVLYQLS